MTPTQALHDLDNIKLSKLTETSETTLTAEYELAHLLVAGSCSDNGAPAAGLQLILGDARRPHVTDTVVMSNLGYFQLKAAPGVWGLSIAPGAFVFVFVFVFAFC